MLLSLHLYLLAGTYVAALYTVELAQLAHGGVVSLGYLGELHHRVCRIHHKNLLGV